MKRYIVNLTEEERIALHEILSRARASREFSQRARILLKADEGLTDEEIADELDVGRATVEGVRRRSVEEGLERALNRKKQSSPSRPPKLDGAGEARLVQLACSAPPKGRKRWTLHLLSNKLVELRIVDSISHSTAPHSHRLCPLPARPVRRPVPQGGQAGGGDGQPERPFGFVAVRGIRANRGETARGETRDPSHARTARGSTWPRSNCPCSPGSVSISASALSSNCAGSPLRGSADAAARPFDGASRRRTHGSSSGGSIPAFPHDL